MEFLIVLAVVAIIVIVVSAPLRRSKPPRPQQRSVGAGDPNALAELEASRDAKYREIRDAELDHRTGKLSDTDYEGIDAALRSEAIEILRAIDRVRGS